ncbi:hypothetical protein ACFOYW_18005 [Gryllotalpicola reticulitermitis]|uniref:Uncharacterized protein n=1 Tax=Gryllotalpicola reticulitermitis TaxID=1184153 RepID=A0ABV8QC69_9MICO
MTTSTELVRRSASRRVAWRGPAAMAVMVLGMADSMAPAHVLPSVMWVAVELGAAIVVAVPGRGARCCTPLAAHRALGLIAMAVLTVAMAGMTSMSTDASTPGTGQTAMAGMGDRVALLPVALGAAALYAGWSLWRARAHEGRLEMLVAAASVTLMGAFAIA